MKKIKSVFNETANFYKQMGKSKKALYLICMTLFSLYLFIIIHFKSGIVPFTFKGSILLIPLIIIIVFFGTYVISKINIEIKNNRDKLSKRVFFSSFGFCLFVLSVYYAAYFPGGFSNDTVIQWQQVQSGNLNDWHPALHTFLILLAAKVVNHIAFVIALQIIVFSLCVGYQTSVLRAFGFPKWLCVISCVFVSLSPPTGNILMYAWKDCAFAIFMILATTQLAQIYFTKGQWLKKPLNAAVFIIILVTALFMRHNAIFAVFPIIFLIAIIYYKTTKNVFLVLIATIVLWGIVKGPVFSIFNVSTHGQAIAESAGAPMTILGNIMKNNPAALSSETKEFLEKIASDEDWKYNYKTGSWNSVKWKDGSLYVPESNEVIEELGVENLLKYTYYAVKNDPYNSFYAFSELTRCVWQPFGETQWSFKPYCVQNDYGFTQSGNSFLKNSIERANSITTSKYFSWTCWCTGFFIFILLAAALSKIPEKGLKALFLIAPVIVYDFCTMLMLCGDDYRFFYFNLPVFIFICAALFSKQKAVNYK